MAGPSLGSTTSDYERWETNKDKESGDIKIVKGPVLLLLSLLPMHVFSEKYEGVDEDVPPQKERDEADAQMWR